MRSLASGDATSTVERHKRALSISTVIILALAAFAGIAYYFGSPPALPSVENAMPCSSQDPQIVIPQGIGVNESSRFLLPTLSLVVGLNNTFGWDDEDTTSPHIVSTVSVPPDGVQWDLNMTGGHTYCITLTTPGTYSYEMRLPSVVAGFIIVKTA